MSEYVKEAIEKKEIDVLDGLKIIIRLFPKNIILDDFMFCVLSICIFISSLMDKLQSDIDTQIKEELKFIDEQKDKNAFLSLGAVFKYSIENSEEGFLSKWYQEIYN